MSYLSESHRACIVAKIVDLERSYILDGLNGWIPAKISSLQATLKHAELSDFERAYNARYSAQYAEHIRNTPLPE